MADSNATAERPALERAIGVTELLEMILLNLSPKDLLLAMRVSKSFHDLINTSVPLRRALFFEQEPEDDKDDSEDGFNELVLGYSNGYALSQVKLNEKALHHPKGSEWPPLDTFKTTLPAPGFPISCIWSSFTVNEVAKWANDFDKHSYSKMYLRKQPLEVEIKIHNTDTPEDWQRCLVDIKGATYGQMIRVVKRLVEATQYQVEARKAEKAGDTSYWVVEKGSWPWQKFFDEDLLRVITTVPIVQHQLQSLQSRDLSSLFWAMEGDKDESRWIDLIAKHERETKKE